MMQPYLIIRGIRDGIVDENSKPPYCSLRLAPQKSRRFFFRPSHFAYAHPGYGAPMSSAPNTTHENRLARETSPYLLQHKHNPVDWWPWGPEALAEAKRTNRPILLSVGYAACHWCHVMAHESFEDEATAAVMNELFVNIKVDREERPDIDQIYMSALQFIGEQGGWPLTMFLDADGEPVWGGTYFPKDPRATAGRPSSTCCARSRACSARSRSASPTTAAR